MPEDEDFQALRADAIEMLETVHKDQIEAWGEHAPRRDPAVYTVFVSPEQLVRLTATLPMAPIIVRDDMVDIARETWHESMRDWSTHGPSEARPIALLLPRP